MLIAGISVGGWIMIAIIVILHIATIAVVNIGFSTSGKRRWFRRYESSPKRRASARRLI